MAETPFIIQEHQFQRIKIILARLCVECAARAVFLVDRDGQPIAFHGDIGDMDTTSFSSLAAGNVAATSSMAKLIGEDTFPAVVHEGERESIFISVIGRSLLVEAVEIDAEHPAGRHTPDIDEEEEDDDDQPLFGGPEPASQAGHTTPPAAP